MKTALAPVRVARLLLGLYVFAGANSSAGAESRSLGAGLMVGPSVYQVRHDHGRLWPLLETNVSLLPDTPDDTSRVVLRADSAGVRLVHGAVALDAIAAMDPIAFDATDADTRPLRSLDSRKSSVVGGVRGTWWVTAQTFLSATVAGDLLGRHRSLVTTLRVQHQFLSTSADAGFHGFVATSYLPSRYMTYYFGVSETEAARSGLEALAMDAGVRTDIGVGVRKALASDITASAGVVLQHYGDSLDPSPLVARSGTLNLVLTLSRRF